MVKHNGYNPTHAKEQILVCFKIDCGEAFARDFGRGTGYTLSDEQYKYGHNVFIYNTVEGEESKACEVFRAYSDFIDWAELRDIKMESKWQSLKEIITMIESLRDNVEIPDKEYYEKIHGIIASLQKLKEGR